MGRKRCLQSMFCRVVGHGVDGALFCLRGMPFHCRGTLVPISACIVTSPLLCGSVGRWSEDAPSRMGPFGGPWHGHFFTPLRHQTPIIRESLSFWEGFYTAVKRRAGQGRNRGPCRAGAAYGLEPEGLWRLMPGRAPCPRGLWSTQGPFRPAPGRGSRCRSSG